MAADGEFEIDDAALQRMVESMELEQQVNPHMGATELAEKIIEDAAPGAAQSIVRMALTGTTEAMRFRAATYICDRVLGKTGDGKTKSAPWDELFSEVSVVIDK